jgi:hypothetical protein
MCLEVIQAKKGDAYTLIIIIVTMSLIIVVVVVVSL